ncbi:hypothetical protein N7481_013020 [Penicillium waksmanii]|uniref:uncharacterized protein n=1 Tax=Penicillium waksmanii TaxID=69791 RepID=UPI0025476FBC|nr:uncharacterized protein N7481_013020 [Penicillium waksmanii]KAJ5966306.1 hypothetical protein N7481_013020 [Penicillium waksmanii]
MEKIDTHCHIVPPGWRKWCEEHGWDKPDGMPCIPEWSAEGHIALMDKLGIKRSIPSITSPGTLLKRVTRETNIKISQICRQSPGRFDVEGSLEEIDHALELGASGFAAMTNAQVYYMGDSRFDPVFKKLNQHKTRAVVNLLLSGTVTQFENLTSLVSHCGATLPPLVERFSAFSTRMLKSSEKMASERVKEIFSTRFYFDLAEMPFPDLIHGYLRIGTPERLLYGSDYPYTPSAVIEILNKTMDEQMKELFDQEQLQRIFSRNACELHL